MISNSASLLQMKSWIMSDKMPDCLIQEEFLFLLPYLVWYDQYCSLCWLLLSNARESKSDITHMPVWVHCLFDSSLLH